MMTSKLDWMRQQLYQMAEPCPEWWDFIKQNKIDVGAVDPHCGTIAVALCKSVETIDGDRLFEFSPNGIPCVVIEAICFRSENGNINPYTADLVAWPIHSPDELATALGAGDGCELLGAWSACRTDQTPLKVHPTPLAWLKTGCDGCVMLKPGVENWLHKAGGPFICGDAEQAREVCSMLGDQAPMHDVLIPQLRRAA